MRALDLTGHRFGRLTVTKRAANIGDKRCWRCRCDCGTEADVMAGNLRSGHTQSCGCLSREVSAQLCQRLSRTHGQALTPTHRSWRNMVYRCTSPSDPSYSQYGGAGVTVCARWLKPNGQGFLNFRADVGERPKGMSLDRIDNSKGYEPSNVRWATATTQQNNRRCTQFLEFEGRRLSVGQWAAEKGITFGALAQRLKMGWTAERALTEAVRPIKRA